MLRSQHGGRWRVKQAKKASRLQSPKAHHSRAAARPSRVAARTSPDQPPPFTAERWLKITIVAGLFAGLTLSPKLWLSDRLYPLTPVVRFLTPIRPPFDFLCYA